MYQCKEQYCYSGLLAYTAVESLLISPHLPDPEPALAANELQEQEAEGNDVILCS